jgi:hypothetical protein
VTRSRRYLIEVLQNAECLLDNLLLFDQTLFDQNKTDGKAIGRIVRVTLELSTYSIEDQIRQWKEVCNSFITLRSKALVEKHYDLRHNAYAWMLTAPEFKPLIDNPSKEWSMRLAHLISTRNLAPGGRKARCKAIEKFKRTTELPFIVPENALHKLDITSEWLGGFCSHLKGTNLLRGGHCSLNNSGTLDMPVSMGGRAADAMIDIRRFLNEVPENGETREYPWGNRFYPAGRPRWQAWGTSTETADVKFLDPVELETLGRRENLAGLGPSTGCMVYTVAYETYRPFKESGDLIPIRQATVSEPGGKVRIVTTGPWWLAVLQQPFAHMFREHIGYHPSAYSVMLRADQAWQALRIFGRLEIDQINDYDDVAVLSSDLECATDAIPHSVGKTLLHGFINGVGGDALKWGWITDLISNRLVFTEDKDVFTLQRGVMMGEPLSKVCLILLGLAMEEIAYREFLGVSLYAIRRPRTPWHAFHIGGDDHLAVGPLPYLKQITANHRTYGSMISLEKHRISKIMVVYTEKVLHFKGTILNMDPSTIDDHIDQSIFVDSMKIRLLSPFTKALDTVNDRNVAIGKLKGIARSIQYLKDSGLKRKILDRALYRFRDFIKGPHHRTIRAVESLPVELGGLGIAADLRYLNNLPPIYNRALRSICIADPAGFQARILLGTCFANDTSRGVTTHDFIGKWINVMIENMAFARPVIGSVRDWFSLIDPNHQLTFRAKLQRLKDRDIIPLSDVPQLIERSYVFRRLLEQKDIRPGYRTELISKRIAKVWNGLEKLGPKLHRDGSPLSEKELAAAQKLAKQVLFINLNETMVLPIKSRDEDGDLTDLRFWRASIRDVACFGQPSMTVDSNKLERL